MIVIVILILIRKGSAQRHRRGRTEQDQDQEQEQEQEREQENRTASAHLQSAILHYASPPAFAHGRSSVQDDGGVFQPSRRRALHHMDFFFLKVLSRPHGFGSTFPMNPAPRSPRALWIAPLAASMMLAPWAGSMHAQQLAPDDAALLVLNAGRRAFNENQFPVAA